MPQQQTLHSAAARHPDAHEPRGEDTRVVDDDEIAGRELVG